MYQGFFGLRERPFDLTPNPRFLVLTDVHKEALSNLEYGIASRRGITALIGDAGTGKTTLIRTALERQTSQVHSVYINNPALTRAEFVETLATRFHLSAEARTSKAALLGELEDALRNRDQQRESSVLIVDEAQSLPLDLLEEIRLLGNIETNETKLLSIVLAGQPELGTRLNDESLRQLKQRVAMRCQLRALTQAETAGYLAGRIRAAGGIGAQVFTREAVMLIHERSAGIPRTVSVIADNALLTAFALRVKPVNSQMVAEVCRDLDLQDASDEADVPEPAPVSSSVEHHNTPQPTPKVLSFDVVDQERSAKSEPVAAAPLEREPEAKINDEATGMFTTMYSKRRRFSFFRG
jgi:general secretion pathway protein A